jgi:hypothetical protein
VSHCQPGRLEQEADRAFVRFGREAGDDPGPPLFPFESLGEPAGKGMTGRRQHSPSPLIFGRSRAGQPAFRQLDGERPDPAIHAHRQARPFGRSRPTDPGQVVECPGQLRDRGIGEMRRRHGWRQVESPARLGDELAHQDRIQVQVAQKAMAILHRGEGQRRSQSDQRPHHLQGRGLCKFGPSASPFLLGEGPGMRGVAGLSRSDRALSSNVTGLATTLTPALSR